MLDQIHGLHHVTALASSARGNNAFFTGAMGLRRMKKTVNFDAPDVYHLYYGDGVGTPGTVMTYFPFPNAKRGQRGTGEVSETAFSVPPGSLEFWKDRLSQHLRGHGTRFGEARLGLEGPDGETLVLVEAPDDRSGWAGGSAEGDVGEEAAIRGFHSVTLRLADATPMAELLSLMGYRADGHEGNLHRFSQPNGDARIVDVEVTPNDAPARQGAGSVHHVAFRVADRARQTEVREAVSAAGFKVTPPIDRDYFWAIYFRTTGGVLFEVATDEPGFDRDEDQAHLGEALKLPSQHEHLRPRLERTLEPID